MAGKPSSEIEVKRRRLRVFELLRVRATPEQILSGLRQGEHLQSGKVVPYEGVSERSLERDLAALRVESNKWVDSMAKDEFTAEYQHVIESLKERVRRLIVAESEATRPHDRVEANLAIVTVEKEIIELLARGPAVWALRRKTEAPQDEHEDPATVKKVSRSR